MSSAAPRSSSPACAEGSVEPPAPGRRRGASRRLRTPLTAAALGAAVLLSGCGPNEAEDEPQSESTGAGIPQPEYDDDETTQLLLAFVSPEGSEEGAPAGGDGNLENPDAPGAQAEEDAEQGDEPADSAEPAERNHANETARSEVFGCQDTVSVIRSEPVVTDDPATSALDFLIEDQRYYHGDPAFINALAASEQQVGIESVETEGDTATVELSGEPITRSDCESWQIIMQLQVTARAATGAESAEILLDGSPLAEALGIPADDVPQVELLEVTD